MRSYAQRVVTAGLSALLLVGGLQLLDVSAAAAGGPTPGVALPTLLDPTPRAGVSSASSDYVLYAGGASYDESDPRLRYAVVDAATGQTVHTFTEPWLQETVLQPSMVRSSYVALVRPSEGHTAVEVRSATTGELERTIDLTGQGGLVHADRQWALVAYSTGPTTGDNGLRFVHADGTTADVPGNFFSVPTYVGGDVTTAYISSNEGDFALDVATGAKTPLPFPDGARLDMVGPTYLIGGFVSGGTEGHYRTLDRHTLEPGWYVDGLTGDPASRATYPYGDTVAQTFVGPDAPDAGHLSLRVLDTATGSWDDLVTDSVIALATMDDGRLALTLDDTPGGRVALASGPTVAPLLDLPDVPETASAIALSGTTASVSWERRSGVWATSTAGDSSWTTTYADGGWSINGDNPRRLWAAGDVVMTENDNGGNRRFRLLWPGGTRDVLTDAAVLGHGGEYVSYYDKVADKIKVEKVRTGDLKALYDGSTFRPIDGSVLWSKANASATVSGKNLTTNVTVQRLVPTSCASGALTDVRGRWAWATSCGGGPKVVDLEGALPSVPVPVGGAVPFLGNGYLLSVSPTSTEPVEIRATVTDLRTAETRSFGPLRGQVTPPGVGLALNDDDALPGFAYLDPTYQPRFVALDWLGQAAVDTTPPVLTANAQVPARVASAATSQVVLGWTWSGDAVDYDVRRATYTGTTWTVVAEGVGYQVSPTVTQSISPGSGACFQARARDAVGNVSSWSPKVCQLVDGTSPVMGNPTGTPVWAPVLKPRVGYSVSARDGDAVASYDVQSVFARPGQRYGPWTNVVSAGARGAVTSAPLAPGSEICYRARARDLAGNVSGWAPSRCYRSPIDDRSFVRGPAVVAKRAKVAIGGTYLQLSRRGSGVAVAHQVGRGLGIWIVRGKRLGIGDVLVGGRRVARIGFAAKTTRRVLVLVSVPAGFDGTVQIVNRSAKPIRFDALSVAR